MVGAILTVDVSFVMLSGTKFQLEKGSRVSVNVECNYAVYNGVFFFLFQDQYYVESNIPVLSL